MTPYRPPLGSLMRRAPAAPACASVYCRQNERRLVAGRPYVTSTGGILTLDTILGAVRISVPQWLMHRGGKLAVFTYRPRNAPPVRFRQRLLGGAVVELPWRLR